MDYFCFLLQTQHPKNKFMSKKIIIFLFSIFFFNKNLSAQKESWLHQTFKAGPVIGTNLSQVDGDANAGIHKIGLHTGVASYVNLNNKLGMQLEILYSQKGSRYTQELNGAQGPYFAYYRMYLNYVEIPLALKYYYTEDIHFGAGISFNRLINSKEEYIGLYGTKEFDSESYSFNKNNWDAFIGIDYQISGRWIAEARYQYSITPIRTLSKIPQGFENGRNQANNLFVIRLGYYL